VPEASNATRPSNQRQVDVSESHPGSASMIRQTSYWLLRLRPPSHTLRSEATRLVDRALQVPVPSGSQATDVIASHSA